MSKIRIFHIGGDDSVIQIADSLGNTYAPLEAGDGKQTSYLDVDLSGGVQLTAQVMPKPIEFKEAEPAPIDPTVQTPAEAAEANAAAEQAAHHTAQHGSVEQARIEAARAKETKLRDDDYEEPPSDDAKQVDSDRVA